MPEGAAGHPGSGDPVADVPGTIGKYAIDSRLGQGGMGAVYHGIHPDLNIPVAVKLLHAKWANEDLIAERFVQEARLAANINHPYVVRVFDAGRHKGHPFLVEEYLDGKSLEELMDAAPCGVLEASEAVRIAIAVGEALAAIHEQGIVHRDVKPANILFTGNRTPKLADLGIAKQFHPNASEEGASGDTEMFTSIGSPLYMAPEQIWNAVDVDIRADIYSLGVVLYQMLTGELPVAGHGRKDLLAHHRHEPVPDPREANPSIPRSLAQVVMKMLAKTPNSRYSTPSEVVDALRTSGSAGGSAFARNAAIFLAVAASFAVLSVVFPGKVQDPGLPLMTDPEGQCLLSQDWGRALPLLERRLEAEHDVPSLLYATALCHLNEQRVSEVRKVITRLEALPGGAAQAKHLEILCLLSEGRDEDAATAIEQCLGTVNRRLPFLLSKGQLLLQRHDFAGAERSLTTAIQSAGFLDCQKLWAVDALGTLLMRSGRPRESARLYAQNLPPAQDAKGAGGIYSNYAIALMRSGETDKAKEVLGLTLHVNPEDELAAYLQSRAAGAEMMGQAAVLEQTFTALDNLAEATDAAAADDPWHSSPIVLVLTAPTGSRQPPDADLWADRLARQIQKDGVFPVVDRRHFSATLSELKIAAVRSPDNPVSLQAGQLWPASILLCPGVAHVAGSNELYVELIDVETSQVLGMVSKKIESREDPGLVCGSLCDQLYARLRELRPPVGLITGTSQGTIGIDLGTVHGLKAGQQLRVYTVAGEAGPDHLLGKEPAGLLRLTNVLRFSAVGVPVPAEGGADQLTEGMVVMGVE